MTTLHPIADVARAAGVSTRTLRHYGAIGLLDATETGAGGLRRYDDRAVVRLQRILLLRGLGLGLDEVRRVLDGERDDVTALTAHLGLLERERDRIDRQLAAVRTTIERIERGEPMDTDSTFDGFDNTQYKDEVVERWGAEAYQRSNDWWRNMSAADKRSFQDEQRAIAAEAAALAESGAAADSEASLALGRRQLAWLRRAWRGAEVPEGMFRGFGDMYVDDARFTAAYDVAGPGAAVALRAAMHALADQGMA
jgi:MerR family transcriptional regulator, thiopeptide resistance regulator